MKPSTAATLALLRRHPEGTTSTDAYFEIHTSRLAARIAELRADGHRIDSRMIRTVTGKHVASYVLVEPDEQMAIRFADAPWEAIHQNQDSTSPDFGRTWTTTGGGKASA